MIILKHLWVVTYERANGHKTKTKFFTFENDGLLSYKIVNEDLKFEKHVTRDEGNNYYLSLLQYDEKAVVNKIC